MNRTVDEKLKYNEGKLDMFSTGYVVGVKNYRNYVKLSAAKKQGVDNLIKQAKTYVKDKTCPEDTRKLYKGVLCGYRDAANERKNRNQ